MQMGGLRWPPVSAQELLHLFGKLGQGQGTLDGSPISLP